MSAVSASEPLSCDEIALAMHAQTFGQGAPQSRDRMYVVFWRKGNQAPDLRRVTSPAAVCASCGPVSERIPDSGRTVRDFVRPRPRVGLSAAPEPLPTVTRSHPRHSADGADRSPCIGVDIGQSVAELLRRLAAGEFTRSKPPVIASDTESSGTNRLAAASLGACRVLLRRDYRHA